MRTADLRTVATKGGFQIVDWELENYPEEQDSIPLYAKNSSGRRKMQK